MSVAASRAAAFGPGALLTPANLLTLGRIAATPPFLLLLAAQPTGWITWATFSVLCATDLVDGKLARRMGATRSGAFLDPLADKVLVLGALFALVAVGEVSWLPVALITLRELAMSAYRSWIGRRGISVPANRAAKLKTWLQCFAAGFVMWPPTAAHPLVLDATMAAAVALTWGTGLHYAAQGWRLVRGR